MSPELLAALAGTGLASGAVLVAAGLRTRTSPRPRSRPRPGRGAGEGPGAKSGTLLRLVVGTAVGAAAWPLTGWPVLLPAAPMAAVGLPLLLGASGTAQTRISRLEAIAEWLRGLAHRLTSGLSLEQALAAGAAGAPEEISAQAHNLAARLRHGQPAPVALRALAEELASFTGDQVAAQLLLAYRRRGPGAAQALEQLADWVAEEAADLRAVEAERARPRFTAHTVTLIFIGAFSMLAASGDYTAPYASAVGQVVLALTLAAFAAALVWMRRITTGPAEPRLLTAPVDGGRGPR